MAGEREARERRPSAVRRGNLNRPVGTSGGKLFYSTCALLLLAFLALPPAVLAGSVSNQRPLLFKFDGDDSSIGALTGLGSIAIDEATGDIYALNEAGNGKGPGAFDAERVVCRFDDEGNSSPFAGGEAAGKSCLDGSEAPGGSFGVEGFFERTAFRADLAIDNSGGAGGAGEGEQGRIYVSEEGGPVHAFTPAGAWLWTLPVKAALSCGIAVDREGHLWIGNGFNGDKRVLEFNTLGKGAPSEVPIDEVPMTHANEIPCRLAIDNEGNSFYVGLARSGPSGVDEYRGGVFDSTLTTDPQFEVTIDQSQQSGHIFTLDEVSFSEYAPCEALGCSGAPVAGSPFGEDLIGVGRGIAYNPSSDRVYVADQASNSIKVFGPAASGTVPDVTIGEADEIGQNEATLRGAVNPQGVPNGYFFEYTLQGAGWASAQASEALDCTPSPPLAEDSSSHAVACEVSGLKANTDYEVRLVGENTTANLKSYSAVISFKTLPPPVPVVDCEEASGVTAESAHIECAVDPQEDQTIWKLLRTVQPGVDQAQCEGLPDAAFKTLIEEGVIPPEVLGTVDVEADLVGLNPAETSCVRAIATNGGGSGNDDLVFRTDAIAPGAAEIAFVAPRGDTTARLNARIDPKGEAALTFHFEYQEEGAVSWTVLPDAIFTSRVRTPSVIGQEVDGLTPGTTYRYRLGKAANEAGAAPSLGGEGSFTTRTSAEVSIPPNALGEAGKRGFELVNNPDKNAQHALTIGPFDRGPTMSADGAQALWTVGGGAPGSNSGSQAAFLAKRTPEGWKSKSLVPPVAEQIGGGAFVYRVESVTPDFTKFIFQVARPDVFLVDEKTIVRLDEAGNQEILGTYQKLTNETAGLAADLSADSAHVVAVNPDNGQLEDIGAGVNEPLSFAPDSAPFSCGLSNEAKGFIGLGNPQWQPGYHWIATIDASRAYFEVMPNKPAPNAAECEATAAQGLYVRNREGKGKTTLIDPGGAGYEPEFIRTIPTGDTAYYLTSASCRRYKQVSPIFCETSEPQDTNGNPDVYRWDEELGKAGEARCLTCEGHPNANLDRVGTLVSDDFSHVYFVSKAELTPQAVGSDRYVYSLSKGQIRLVAPVGALTQPLGGSLTGSKRAVALSPDGNVLTFVAPGGITSDRVAAECPQTPLVQAGVCEELYRYDDRDGSIECLSCQRGGLTTHSIGSNFTAARASHFKMSTDASTVAFATSQRLIEADVNNDVDIYEWRNSVIRLITDGVTHFKPGENAGPQVAGIDADGEDILITLVAPDLTGYERDRLANVYDARIGGGFPRPAPAEACHEDDCQGPLQPAPSTEPASSTRFQGKGNLKGHKPRCRKGKHRRKGRCVPKRGAPKHKSHGQRKGDKR